MKGEAVDSYRGFRTSIRTLSRENFFSLIDATTMPAKDTPERHLNFGGVLSISRLHGLFADGRYGTRSADRPQSCADSHRGLRCQKGRLRGDASAWALIYINTRAPRPASMALSEWLPGLTAFTEGGRGPSESSGRGGESAPARLYLGGGARRDLRAGANTASSLDVPAGSDPRVEDRATAQQSAVRFAVRPGTQPSRRNRRVGAR